MDSKKQHLDEIEKKQNESIEKYNIHMLGSGMFSDFDKLTEEKRVKQIKEKKNE